MNQLINKITKTNRLRLVEQKIFVIISVKIEIVLTKRKKSIQFDQIKQENRKVEGKDGGKMIKGKKLRLSNS